MSAYLLTAVVLLVIAAVFGLAFVADRATRRATPCPMCAAEKRAAGKHRAQPDEPWLREFVSAMTGRVGR
jgi:hypothetical protein